MPQPGIDNLELAQAQNAQAVINVLNTDPNADPNADPDDLEAITTETITRNNTVRRAAHPLHTPLHTPLHDPHSAHPAPGTLASWLRPRTVSPKLPPTHTPPSPPAPFPTPIFFHIF